MNTGYPQNRAGRNYNAQNSFQQNTLERKISGASIPAAICLLLRLVLLILYYAVDQDFVRFLFYNYTLIFTFVLYIFLAIAAFITAGTRKASVMYLIGFSFLFLLSVDSLKTFLEHANLYANMKHIAIFTFVINICFVLSNLFMLLFSIFSLESARERYGSFVRAAWFIPIVLMIPCLYNNIRSLNLIFSINMIIKYGRYDVFDSLDLYPLSQILYSLVYLFMPIAFRRICKKGASQKLLKPSLQPSTVSVNNIPAQTTFAPAEPSEGRVSLSKRESAPQTPSAPNMASQEKVPLDKRASAAQTPVYDDETKKQLDALKDLLACGILTQEEYDENERKLTQK
ncbi:MAG: SHOCT domain-containing protein [Clostridia bacterium]|nr:SHOCT domain-containing protein [Clostridia bacterium]MBQ4157662.1 SHOCT domain-containing protein [Clostridia bacterium]